MSFSHVPHDKHNGGEGPATLQATDGGLSGGGSGGGGCDPLVDLTCVPGGVIDFGTITGSPLPPSPGNCDGPCQPTSQTPNSGPSSGLPVIVYVNYLSPTITNTGGSGVGGSNTTAKNKNKGCSVLDANCKNPGPVTNWINFLACEAAISINDLGHSGAAGYGAAATGAIGVKQMISFLNGASKGVPIINEIAAVYDVTMMSIEAVNVNQACTAAVYGN